LAQYQYFNFSDLGVEKKFIYKIKIINGYHIKTSLFIAVFKKTDLSDTIFQNCGLSRADFCGAKYYVTDISVNKIKKLNF